MKKAEFWTRMAVFVLAILALIAVVLQIINDKTNSIETAYEIITFSVAVVALLLAVTQGAENVRISKELKKIMSEVHEIIDDEKTELQVEKKLARELEEDLKISRENAELLKKNQES